MTHRKPTYSGTKKLDDHSLSPHPRTVFPVHRDRAGDLQEAAAKTPLPVLADLGFGDGLRELLNIQRALLLESRLHTVQLNRLIAEELTVEDVEKLDG